MKRTKQERDKERKLETRYSRFSWIMAFLGIISLIAYGRFYNLTFISKYYLLFFIIVVGIISSIIHIKSSQLKKYVYLRSSILFSTLVLGCGLSAVFLMLNYYFAPNNPQLIEMRIIDKTYSFRKTSYILTVEYAGQEKDLYFSTKLVDSLSRLTTINIEIKKGLLGLDRIKNYNSP